MTDALPPLGLYIHLPWCERKCPYCDFNSHEVPGSSRRTPGSGDLPEHAYVDQLLRDLEAEAAATGAREVQTLFIGGGTPSLFSVAAIERLLAGVGARIPLAPDLEATLEANPGSAEAEKFSGFRAAGINRLSIGAQSFQDGQLAALGRIHDSAQALAAIDIARRAGFDSFNVDLMHGLPGQAAAGAAADLHRAMTAGAPHISWYQLTLEPNTVFYKQPPPLPAEDLLAEIQGRGEALLTGAGYRQYEVSAWARPGFRCRHNLNYWQFGDYIGLGAGAHGKLTDGDSRILRYHKTRRPADYLSSRGTGRCGVRFLSGDDLAEEFALNALRLREGFELELFEVRTGLARGCLSPTLEKLEERGLLELVDNRVKASALGYRFLDSVVAEFLRD